MASQQEGASSYNIERRSRRREGVSGLLPQVASWLPRVCECSLKGGLEVIQLERLLERRPIAVAIRDAGWAIASRKDEWHTAGSECIGQRCYWFAVKIDVENGDVEIRLFGDLHRLVQACRRGGNRVAEFGQHVLEQHADHEFVFDDEDPPWLPGDLRFGC
jgi:hypothetical protein